MPDETIRCPACQFECKAWATVCASCMVEFQKWLGTHPGQSIQGWKPGQRSVSASPSPFPQKLDPVDVASADTDASAKNGGAILAILAAFQIIAYFLIGFIAEDKDEELQTLKLGCIVASFIFGGLSFGAFKGKRICIWLGLALIVLDWVFTIATNPTMAFRGVFLKAYFIYALYKAASA